MFYVSLIVILLYMNVFNFLSRFQVAELVKAYQNSTEHATSQNKSKRETKKTDVATSQNKSKRETKKKEVARYGICRSLLN